MYSLVIPVYRNEDSIPELLLALNGLARKIDGEFEVIFVIDGSPDRSLELLETHLPASAHQSRVLALSRNFGSFAAIRTTP